MTAGQRLTALDIFRGMTIMLMILVNTPGSFEHVYPMMEHAPWQGCTFADLVFPFFLFSVGFSSFLSCRKYNFVLSSALIKKILRRTLILFLLGILFNTFPYYDVTQGLSWDSISSQWSQLRLYGILQRIALAYLLSTLLCLYLKSTRRILLGAALLLILHTAGLILYHPAAPYLLETNLSRTIDLWFPGMAHLYQGFGIPFDPEGLYGALSAAVNAMLGFLAGRYYTSAPDSPKTLHALAGAGFLCLAIGLVAGWKIIICKALWTASYVMLTSGIALLLFTALLYITPISPLMRLMHPARAFGENPLFFFFASAFIALSFAFPWLMIGTPTDAMPAYNWLYTSFFENLYTPEFGSLLFGIVYLFLCGLGAEFLYCRKIILKI